MQALGRALLDTAHPRPHPRPAEAPKHRTSCCTRVPAKPLPFNAPIANQTRGRQRLHVRSDELPAGEGADPESAQRSPSRCTRVPTKSLPFKEPIANQLRGRRVDAHPEAKMHISAAQLSVVSHVVHR